VRPTEKSRSPLNGSTSTPRGRTSTTVRSTTPYRNVTLAMPEPLGVIGIVSPEKESPLLGFDDRTTGSSHGNRVVIVRRRESTGRDRFYQVLDTSDLPGGDQLVTGAGGQAAFSLRTTMWMVSGTSGTPSCRRRLNSSLPGT
jgi:hypothetical protein